MFTTFLRAKCDTCEKTMTFNTSNEGEASAMLRKRGWYWIEYGCGVDLYFCCRSCAERYLESTQTTDEIHCLTKGTP